MAFEIDGRDAVSYLRRHLMPVRQDSLRNEEDQRPLFSNVVSNAKLDPGSAIPLLDLSLKCPNSEIKSGFGALVMRFMHALTKDQERVPGLKSSAATHLCFSKGALGSTGNRSKEEALLACHEFRMFLYYACGIRTNFRRFTIPNMVCSSSVGYCINIAKLHADDQVNTDYYPDLFPGLFYYYKYTYKDRVAIHDAQKPPSGGGAQQDGSSEPATKSRRVKLLEDDLLQLHRHSSSASRSESDDVVRSQVKKMLDTYLQLYKVVVVLAFIGGKLVGLGVDDKEMAEEAFRHVGSITPRYRISDREASEFKRRRKSQHRVEDKEQFMEEKRISHSGPLSKEARKKIDALSAEDEETRKARIKQILAEEKGKKSSGGGGKKGSVTEASGPAAKRARRSSGRGGEEDLEDEVGDLMEEMLEDDEPADEEMDSSGAADSRLHQQQHSDDADSVSTRSGGGPESMASEDCSVMNSLLQTAEGGREATSARLPDDYDDIDSLLLPKHAAGSDKKDASGAL